MPASASEKNDSAERIRQRVRQLTDNAGTWQFVDFMLAEGSDDSLPDYSRIDILRLPTMVPKMFVIDLRNGYEDGLLIKFSGTLIDEHFGANVQGRYLEDVYRGDMGVTAMRDLYRRCADRRELYFRQRESSYEYRIRGLQRGAQDLLIVPVSDGRLDETCRRVAYLVGTASFAIRPGVTETTEAFVPMPGF